MYNPDLQTLNIAMFLKSKRTPKRVIIINKTKQVNIIYLKYLTMFYLWNPPPRPYRFERKKNTFWESLFVSIFFNIILFYVFRNSCYWLKTLMLKYSVETAKCDFLNFRHNGFVDLLWIKSINNSMLSSWNKIIFVEITMCYVD